MKRITVDLGARSYPIYIAAGCLNQIGDIVSSHQLERKIALITDENVGPLYSDAVEAALKASGFQVSVYVLPAGEASKSLETADKLYEYLIRDRFDRKSTIISLGGGVIGDVGGFIAATFMRGIRFVQIPTTLLAQTDSSVGGKVGINHRFGKNLIGAFYQPCFVLIDPQVLETLPLRERRAGMAEVVKYGLIADETFFDFLAGHLEDVIQLAPSGDVEGVIETCCSIKARVVQQDEREGGLRQILNFGHTAGHALEALTNFEFYRHGEAVAMGMRCMTWLSWQSDFISEADFSRIDALLQRFPQPSPQPVFESNEILEKIYSDKKVFDGKLNVVLLSKIGEALVKKNLDPKAMLAALEWMNRSSDEIKQYYR
ncbi:3-dehydroquinate synthase [candidate division KSB1 bacterium]|nr:3-dehydroquinate synthase [candidate division KSB1 bacterium]